MDQVQTYVNLFKDVITSAAAAIAAYIAIKGYNIWKEQLRGQAEHELARRVLIAVYRVRNVLRSILFYAELEDSMVGDLSSFDKTELEKSVDKKFEKLHEMEATLSVELLEAEAMWGDQKNYNSKILQFTNLGSLLDQAVNGFRRILPKDLEEKYQNRIFDYDFDYRKFSATIEESVKQVEDVLRPKLRLKNSKAKR